MTAITTARAATTAIKRALRDAGLEVPTVRGTNAGCMGPAEAVVSTSAPEAEAVLAAIPGASEVSVSPTFVTVRF